MRKKKSGNPCDKPSITFSNSARISVLELFSDGQWHTTQDAVAKASHLVKPEIGFRRYFSQRGGKLTKGQSLRDDELKIIQGQRSYIQRMVCQMVCQGALEKQKGEFGKMEYRKVYVDE